MADRGFNICEILGSVDASLEIPAFTKGKNQSPALEVEKTRTIANVRIHVEQVIGSLQQKYILKQTIPITFLGFQIIQLYTLVKIVAVSCYVFGKFVSFCCEQVLLKS